MILRKPYAFFIRMFKPIHLVIGLLIGILVSTEGRMYGFLNRNANTSLNLIGQNLKSEYITLSLYVIPIVVILLFMGIFVIMFYKKKPVTFYVAGIISLIAVIIINAYATAFFSELNEAIVAIKYVKLTRDLSLIAMIIEIVLLVFVLIRGAGVNIQKFNFDSDISKIDIKDSDNEEFEVNVSLNIDKAKRDRNKRIRYLKYAYAENKLKVNIAIGVIVFLLVVVSFVLFNKRTRIFSEKQSVGTMTCNIMVDNSYIVNKSYDGDVITDKYLIVVDAKIRLNYDGSRVYFNDFNINIKNSTYTPTTMFNKYLIDLGTGFSSENLTKEFNNYLFVYEVPKSAINKKIIFTYNDGNKLHYIKLKPKNIDAKNETITKNLGEELLFDEKLKGVTLSINEYDIQDRYALNYSFCVKNNDCINSIEYIQPQINRNYDKAVIKLNIDYKNESELKLNKFYDLVKSFGYIEYKIDDTTKKFKDIESIVSNKASKKNIVFLGVNRELLNATEVNFIFNIRGKKYIYKVK